MNFSYRGDLADCMFILILDDFHQSDFYRSELKSKWFLYKRAEKLDIWLSAVTFDSQNQQKKSLLSQTLLNVSCSYVFLPDLMLSV
jgi:hypothetical protein